MNNSQLNSSKASRRGQTTSLVEDSHIVAANAEMTRLAAQMGISTIAEEPPRRQSQYSVGNLSPMELIQTSPNPTIGNSTNPYSPTSHRMETLASLSDLDDENSVPKFYDCHGNRAPYYEGPYYIKYEKDGTKIKKRWCKCISFLSFAMKCTSHSSNL
jgi:hypothetical protein